MNSESWGMIAFLITTIVFSASTLICARKLAQAQQLVNQLKEKLRLDQDNHYRKQ